MFENMIKEYIVYGEVTETDEYNQTITSYEPIGTIEMILGLSARTALSNEALDITQCDVIGVTKDSGVAKGMLIDKYEVVYVIPFKRGRYYVYLKERESNGYFNR